ncbi:MAG: hypothetical protein IIZ83_08410 [Oscillospiraceae bacterium]|nr:hypothetical protein [Oscillospiraceae bacterium]
MTKQQILEQLLEIIEQLLEMVREMAGIIDSAGITVAGSNYAEEIRQIEEVIKRD